MAEDDLELTWRRALVDERRAIMRISESSGASMLEKLRVVGSPASLRTVIVVPATDLIRTESFASTLASHHRTVNWRPPELQPLRTRGEEISSATDDRADPLPLVRRYRHRHVEPVDEADAVGSEVLVAVVECDLGQRRRSLPAGAVAFDSAAAVAGGAGEVVVGVRAAGSGPDPTRPVVVRGGEGMVGESVESETASLEDVVAGVGLDGWPDSEGTVVDHGQHECRVGSVRETAEDQNGREEESE